MKGGAIRDKSFEFAIRVVKLSRLLGETHREYVLSKQLLRSGTSIGALVRESAQAESKPDFIHKMAIALKEAQETGYWLELLKETAYLDAAGFRSIQRDLLEIISLLTRIIKTAKSRR